MQPESEVLRKSSYSSLGVRNSAAQRYVYVLAQTWHARAHTSLPEDAIAKGHEGVKCLAFVEAVRYDEATSVLAVEQSPDSWADICPGDNVALDRALCQLLEQCPIVEAAPAKLFQTETTWGALVSVQQPDQPCELVVVTSEMISGTQVLQRTTATAIAQAFLMSSMVRPRAVASIPFKLRFMCSDRYSAQLAAKRGILATRGWVSCTWGARCI